MIDADYEDNEALLENTPAQAECLLPHLEQAASTGIGLYVNAIKTEVICFNQQGVISTLSGKPRKFVKQFTYFSRNISSTESDVNIRLAKA